MNEQKFTQKSLEVLNNAQRIALDHNNMQIEQEHLVYALLDIQESLILELFKKIGVNSSIKTELYEIIEKMPGVTGSGREADKVYISNDVDKALSAAEKQATKMKDEYISVEHIMLGILEKPNSKMKELFSKHGITTDKFLSALMTVRGNTRVTSDNPEETYNVLKKYGTD